MDFQEINVPADLTGLSRAEFDGLRARVIEAGRATASLARKVEGDEKAEALEALSQLREAHVRLEAEEERRAAEAAETDAVIAEAEAEFAPADEELSNDTPAEGEEEDEDEEEMTAEAAVTDEETTPDQITASARSLKIRAAASRNREVPPAKPKANTHRAPSNDLLERWNVSLRRAAAGTPERFLTFSPREGGEVVQGNQSAEHNTKIMLAGSPEAGAFLAAAGGWECGAPEVLTGIQQAGRTDRPVGELIGSFTARGKALYHRQVGLDDILADGTAIWTEQQDLDIDPEDPGTHKPCYSLACVDAVESKPVAIPMCFEVGVGQEWASPEQVAGALAKFDVALARRSESAILQRLHEQSNQYTYVPPVGESVSNGMIRLVAHLLSLAGYNGRNAIDGYSLIVPEAMVLQMIADSAMKAWVGPMMTRAQIVAQLEDRFGVRVVITPDVRSGGYGDAVPAPVPALPAAPNPDGGDLGCLNTRFEVLLAHLDDFRVGVHDVALDVRTSITEARQNKKHMFSESFITTEKLGAKPSFSTLYDGSLVTGSQPDLVEADSMYCPDPQPDPYTDFPGNTL